MPGQAGFSLGIFVSDLTFSCNNDFYISIIIVNGDIKSIFYLDLVGQAKGAIYEVLKLNRCCHNG